MRFVFFAAVMFSLFWAPLTQAQNRNTQVEVQREWQSGEKALRAQKFDAAIAHFDRVVTAL